MGIVIDKLSGNPMLVEIKEADLTTALQAKVNQGKVAGVFTSALPTAPIATDKVYDFAGTNATLIGGITWYNGDSAYYNGSAWVRIPFQSLANYYTKSEVFTKTESTSFFDTRYAEILPNNVIVGEGTQNPTIITITNGNNLSIAAVANDVIFPTKYAYKRRYTGTASSGSVFNSWTINYPAQKPSIISFRYWVKDADINTVYGSKGSVQNFWLYDTGTNMIHMLAFNNVSLIASVGATTSGTFNYTGKMSGKWEVNCIDKRDGYSCIVINWYDIVYDPSYTKTNFVLYHIFNNVMPELFNKTIDYVGFTLIFDAKITNSGVYPDTGGKQQYPPTTNSLSESIETLSTNVNQNIANLETNVNQNIANLKTKVNGSTVVIIDGSSIYIRTSFNSVYDIVQIFTIPNQTTNYSNRHVNFNVIRLVNKNTTNTSSAISTGILLSQGGDDACPNNYNSTYIGANHGNSSGRLITANGHGKTTEDIGSEWTDSSGRKFYIIRIVSANQLWVLSENIGTSDVFSFDTSIDGSTLTHSANALHTSAITFTANELVQIIPAVKNNSVRILLDGKTEVSANGIYYCNFIDIVNQYDTVNTASMLSNMIAAVGRTYTDTELHNMLASGDATIFNQICYRVQKNGALQVIYGWRTYHEIYLGYMGFIQAGVLPKTDYPNLKAYMPKVLPITVGARTWDMRVIEDFNVAPTDVLNVIPSSWEVPTAPPDRLVEYMCDASGNKKIGFAMGYDITKGIGLNRKDLINNAWTIYTTRKSYPFGINSKLNNVPANTWYSAICYRIFFDCENTAKGNATNLYYYELGKDVIVYIDTHTTLSFQDINLPAEYVGKSVSIIEKSANMTLHTDIVMQDGVTISASAGTYGYLVLKIS